MRPCMKLLIVTQVVDIDDPILGFFHHWVEELAKRFEHVQVVCLREGRHSFPSNVEVVPLGGTLRLLRALEVCSIAFGRRKEYEAVFVHMSQEFVLAAGWLWKMLGKRVYLWRNHYAGSILTDIAAAFSTKVFCTSKYSYTAKYGKTVRMPVGIDTDIFVLAADISRNPNSILSLGRVAPSKKLHVLIEALALLKKRGVHFCASLYGSVHPSDEAYSASLKLNVSNFGLADIVMFHPGIPHSATPSVYNEHGIFVNLSESGMYDKTIFEAAACGTVVLAASKDLAELADERCITTGDSADIATKLEALLALSAEEREGLRAALRALAERHSLAALGERLSAEMAV